MGERMRNGEMNEKNNQSIDTHIQAKFANRMSASACLFVSRINFLIEHHNGN